MMRDQSEMTQAEEMVGLDGEHLRIDFLRRTLPPRAKIFERQRRRVVRRRAWPYLRRSLSRRFAFALRSPATPPSSSIATLKAAGLPEAYRAHGATEPALEWQVEHAAGHKLPLLDGADGDDNAAAGGIG